MTTEHMVRNLIDSDIAVVLSPSECFHHKQLNLRMIQCDLFKCSGSDGRFRQSMALKGLGGDIEDAITESYKFWLMLKEAQGNVLEKQEE